MATEDRIVSALERRGPLTYDQLRHELDCAPGDLDDAIPTLTRQRTVERIGALFRIPGPPQRSAMPKASPVAQAVIAQEQETMKKKICKTCQEEKPTAEFNVDNSQKDKLSRDCKACKRAYQASRRKAAEEEPAKRGAPVLDVGAPLILQTETGICLCNVSIDLAGQIILENQIHLTGEQVEAIAAWHADHNMGDTRG